MWICEPLWVTHQAVYSTQESLSFSPRVVSFQQEDHSICKQKLGMNLWFFLTRLQPEDVSLDGIEL